MKRILTALFLVLSFATLSIAQPPHSRHSSHHSQPEQFYPVTTPEQTNSIVLLLKHQSFDKDRLEIAKVCVSLCNIPVVGLADLADVFSFDDSRLEFLKFAYSYCADPEHYFMLKDHFTFSSNYDNLMEHISRR